GRGHALLARARAEQDALTGHFRALVEGFKDLKLNRERREAFLSDSIRAASARVRDGNTAGLGVFPAGGGGGPVLCIRGLGVVLFALPAVAAVPRDALAVSVLTLLFAFSPLDAVLGAWPLLGRASASLTRVEAIGLSLDTAGAEEAGGPEVAPPATLDGP